MSRAAVLAVAFPLLLAHLQAAALDLCVEPGNKNVKTPQADGTCRRGELVTVEEGEGTEPPVEPQEIITITGKAQVLYTVPVDNDLLLTDLCAIGTGSTSLLSGRTAILTAPSQQCHSLTTGLLIAGGEELGCEGQAGCSFTGILIVPPNA